MEGIDGFDDVMRACEKSSGWVLVLGRVVTLE